MATTIEACAEAMCDPAAAVLVGAGASAEAGLPTWRALLEGMADSAPAPHGDSVRAFLAEGKYLEAAETARLAISDDQAWNAFFEPFSQQGKTTSTWNLVASLGLSKMVTTNWDSVGEDSFASVWHRAAAVHVGLTELLTPLGTLYPHIVHVHGKVPRWRSLVFTKSQYAEAERSREYQEFWIDLLVKRPLLIVGFSGDDPAFQSIRRLIADLGVAHLAAPFVVHGASRDVVSAFGARSVSVSYNDTDGHRALGELLRGLRGAIEAARARRQVPESPLERAGVPESYLARKEDLLLALAGIDFRSLCDSESLIALTVLLRELGAAGATTADAVTDATVALMRVSRAEANEAANSAIRIARGRGWVVGDGELRPSGLTPRPSAEPFNALLAHISREAQRPITWVPSEATTRFMKDAVLGYLGASGGRAAGSLLGLEVGLRNDPERLRRAVISATGGFGSTLVETQICAAAIRVLDNPPEELAQTCGQLSSFALATHMASLSTGRELLRGAAIDKLYLDANVFLPAIAPGHAWHGRCASLLARCERHVRSVLILDGFAEEARIQFGDARAMAGQISSREEFFRATLARARPNVFLDAFGAWASAQPPTPSFDDYCNAVGLGRDVMERVRGGWSNISVVAPPRSFGRCEALHARIQWGLSSAMRHSELAKHEADQLALLALDLDGSAPSARFVTAHARLREFVTREHMRVARAVVPPVALAHLLAIGHPTEIPPASLREVAFTGIGFEVTESVFALLIDRWRGDARKLRALVTEEVAERLRAALLAASDKEGFFDAIDSRQGLAEVVMRDIVPVIEANLPRAANSRELTRPPDVKEGPEAAARLASELLGDLKFERPKKG